VGAYPPPYGGVQIHIAQLESFLERQGHSCFVINLGKNKGLSSSRLVSPKNSFEVAFHLFKKRDHICHLHFGGTFHVRLLLLALFANLIFYKKCAITVHSGGLSVWGLPGNFIRKAFLYGAFSQCKATICVNSKIRDYFKDLGIKAERLHIISPFAFEHKLGMNYLPDELRFFVEAKKPLICNIGLLEPEYDLDLLLRVFSEFVKVKNESGLVMIGSGSLKNKIMQRIIELGLQEKVLLTGDLCHDITLKMLALSDCYVRASLYDGDCLSLREAIHLGIPAIATETGMRPRGTILFPVGDEEVLMNRLIDVTSAKYERENIMPQNNISHLSQVEQILIKLGCSS